MKFKEGFTFVELIVAMALLGVLAAIFGMGLVQAMRSWDLGRANVRISQKGQLAMVRISRELMELVEIYDVQLAPNPAIVYGRVVNIAGSDQINVFGLQFNPATGLLSLYALGDKTLLPNPSVANLTVANAYTLIDQVAGFSLQYNQGANLWTWGADPQQRLSTIRASLSLTRPDNPARNQNFSTLIYLRNTYNLGGAAPTTNPPSIGDYNCFIRTVWETPIQ